ncbi:hypothetical protein ACFYOK_18175 [Microbispora bryophytorum]|uniref:hypothetical protein n=1 Tax=Microbispora bryophytorum TaxID=1460882 RepID=UPI0033F20A98
MAAGFLSADHAGMGVLADQIQAVPGVSIAVHDGGPFLFSIGQLALVVQLAAVRRVKAGRPSWSCSTSSSRSSLRCR